MKTIQHKGKGFTLIELMIVVAIVAILAAIALPAYQDYTKRARVSEALSMSSYAKVAVAEFFNTQNRWPVDNQEALVMASTSIVGKGVSGVTVDRGVIKVTMSHRVVSTGQLWLTPIADGSDLSSARPGVALPSSSAPNNQSGSIKWLCSHNADLKAKWVPTECRNPN
ncbi:MAG: pilin [Neisseriaceae bacterium]|nr:pilin [Neisseriaceae bacterium]